MLTKKQKVAPYDFFVGVHEDYLYIEVFPNEEALKGNSLKIPMEKLYKDEIDFVLGFTDWQERDLEGYTDKIAYNKFSKAEMPKLLAWWLHFLPTPSRKR